MSDMKINGLEMIEEHEASGEVIELYETVKRDFQYPEVPNMIKALAMSPQGLRMYVDMIAAFYAHLTLPQSLISMICYTVAEKSNCTYCTAAHELTCRTLGVDEATLAQIADDLGSVNPERIRIIIDFALKAAKKPQTLTPEDYDAIRAQGISNDEITQIILVSGIAVFLDIVADSLKIDIDDGMKQALGQ